MFVKVGRFQSSFVLFQTVLLCAVKYRVALDDGTTVAETPEEGTEFYVKDGIILNIKYATFW